MREENGSMIDDGRLGKLTEAPLFHVRISEDSLAGFCRSGPDRRPIPRIFPRLYMIEFWSGSCELPNSPRKIVWEQRYTV